MTKSLRALAAGSPFLALAAGLLGRGALLAPPGWDLQPGRSLRSGLAELLADAPALALTDAVRDEHEGHLGADGVVGPAGTVSDDLRGGHREDVVEATTADRLAEEPAHLLGTTAGEKFDRAVLQEPDGTRRADEHQRALVHSHGAHFLDDRFPILGTAQGGTDPVHRALGQDGAVVRLLAREFLGQHPPALDDAVDDRRGRRHHLDRQKGRLEPALNQDHARGFASGVDAGHLLFSAGIADPRLWVGAEKPVFDPPAGEVLNLRAQREGVDSTAQVVRNERLAECARLGTLAPGAPGLALPAVLDPLALVEGVLARRAALAIADTVIGCLLGVSHGAPRIYYLLSVFALKPMGAGRAKLL